MTNAEARFNNSLRPRKPEGSLRRTAQDGHLDSHTAPELWTRRAQHTSFNTLDNWGHKTPTQSKRRRTGKKDCIVQELCESRGGRPGLSVLTSPLVSVDVKIY